MEVQGEIVERLHTELSSAQPLYPEEMSWLNGGRNGFPLLFSFFVVVVFHISRIRCVVAVP